MELATLFCLLRHKEFPTEMGLCFVIEIYSSRDCVLFLYRFFDKCGGRTENVLKSPL